MSHPVLVFTVTFGACFTVINGREGEKREKEGKELLSLSLLTQISIP